MTKTRLILYVVFIATMLLISSITIQGCEKKAKTEVTNSHYQGLIEGCKAHWSATYCPDFLKPSMLNAGMPISVLVDENGSAIILSPKQVQDIKATIEEGE